MTLFESLGFFGSRNSGANNSGRNVSTTNTLPPSTEKSTRSGLTRYRELNEPVTGGSRKRGREAEEGDMDSKKKRHSEHERRLMQSHVPTPSDARRIAIPEIPTSIKRRTANVSNPRRAGGFKPQNTLDEQPHASESRMRTGYVRNEPVTGRLPPPRQSSAKRVNGSSTFAKKEHAEEIFDEREEQVNKKQKLSNGSPHSASQRAVDVDLTKEPSQLETSPFFGNPVQRSTGKNASPTYLPVELGVRGAVARGAWKYTEIPGEKKRRKERNSAESSQTSTRDSSNQSQPQVSTNMQPKRLSPKAVVDVDTFPFLREGHSLNAKQPLPVARQPHGTVRQEVEMLGKDLESERAVKPSSNGMHASGGVKQTKQQEAQRRSSRQIVLLDQAATDRLNAEQARVKDVPAEPRLAEQFERYDPDGSINRPLRASERMRATSGAPDNSGLARASLGSVDELTGETTVRSKASQKSSAAPNRADRSNDVDSLMRNGRSPPAEQDQSKSSNRQSKKQAPKADEKNNQIRIPVDGIWCRACLLEQKGIELVWDAGLIAFVIECDGERQRIPHRDQVAFIGKSEVHDFLQTSESDVLDVYIRGSVTNNSNRCLLIRFSNPDGLDLCRTVLQDAYKGTMKVAAIPAERMKGIMKTQREEIRSDYHANEGRLSRNTDAEAEAALLHNRKDTRYKNGPADDEAIKYDSPDDNYQRVRRVLMDAERSFLGDSLATRPKPYIYTGHETRRSSRQTQPIRHKSLTPPPRWTQMNKLTRWTHSVVYPPEGSARRVTVDFQDLERLDEGEFLNDNIISFALRRAEETMAPVHKGKVHFFNTFFYETLTKKFGKKGFYYDAVKRWTKNVDLFQIPYVVIPINIDLHWFVAIICNLDNLVRKPLGVEDDADDSVEMLDNPPSNSDPIIPEGTITTDPEGSARDTQESMELLSLSDGEKLHVSGVEKDGQALAAGDEHEPSSSRPSTAGGKKPKKKFVPPVRKYDPDAPTIITLDSFGSGHSAETRNLKDYLNAEAESKRGMEVGTKDLQGMTAKGIPEQTNFCDCGVYVVGYIEEFAKDPKKFVTKVLQREMDKQSEFANFDPSWKRAQIRDQLLKLYAEQDSERKAKKAAPKQPATAPVPPSKDATTQAPTKKNSSEPNVSTKAPPASVTESTHPDQFLQQLQENTKILKPVDKAEDLEMEVPRPLEDSDRRAQANNGAKPTVDMHRGAKTDATETTSAVEGAMEIPDSKQA